MAFNLRIMPFVDPDLLVKIKSSDYAARRWTMTQRLGGSSPMGLKTARVPRPHTNSKQGTS